MSDLKILHGPTTVGGNPQGLSKAERDLGHESKSLTLVQNYFNYDVDEVVFKNEKISIGNEIRRWLSIFKALKNNNVLHYNAGQTIAPVRSYPSTNSYPKWLIFLYSDVYARLTEFLDLRIAKLLGRVTAMTYQGSDARQGEYCRQYYPIHFCHEAGYNDYNDSTDLLKQKRIKAVDHHTDLIYAVNPDLMNVLPKRTRFTPYASVDPREWIPVFGDKNPEVPHIVHAPSHRLVKGTSYILKAFERLKDEGVLFRYTLVENLSNAEARKVYETADLLVDQLLAGYYGGLSVELMALGKPVICYMRDSDMHHLPDKMYADMPVINANPDDIYDVLKEWLTTRKSELRQRGQLSREYVETWHDPQKIAAQIIEDYKQVRASKG